MIFLVRKTWIQIAWDSALFNHSLPLYCRSAYSSFTLSLLLPCCVLCASVLPFCLRFCALFRTSVCALCLHRVCVHSADGRLCCVTFLHSLLRVMLRHCLRLPYCASSSAPCATVLLYLDTLRLPLLRRSSASLRCVSRCISALPLLFCRPAPPVHLFAFCTLPPILCLLFCSHYRWIVSSVYPGNEPQLLGIS